METTNSVSSYFVQLVPVMFLKLRHSLEEKVIKKETARILRSFWVSEDRLLTDETKKYK